MDINGGFSTFRHRHSPPSDRFLRQLSLSSASSSDFELNEADLFFTNGGFNDSSTSPDTTTTSAKRNGNKLGFRMQETSGILAALPGNTTPFRSIPKPQRGVSSSSDSSQFKKFQHSAPVNVPSMMMKKTKKFGQLSDWKRENGEDEEEEMLPPHEIVAMKLKSTSSVLEGVGRTLKGRDLRQVRNAVWRQTGFLD